MAYEHAQAVNQVAKNVMDIVKILTDETPDEQQIASLLAESTEIVSQIMEPLAAEEKQAYKGKFLAKLALAVANRGLDLALPDSES